MTPERLAEIDEVLGVFVKMGDGSQEDAYFELLAHIDAQAKQIEQLQADRAQLAKNVMLCVVGDVGYAEMAVDPNGDVCIYEGGCFWDGERWENVDGDDGLQYVYIGNVGEQKHANVMKWTFKQEYPYTLKTFKDMREAIDNAKGGGE